MMSLTLIRSENGSRVDFLIMHIISMTVLWCVLHRPKDPILNLILLSAQSLHVDWRCVYSDCSFHARVVFRVSEIGWWRSRSRANCRRWRTTLDSCGRRSLSSNSIRRLVTHATNWPSFDDGHSLTVARIFISFCLLIFHALSGMLTIVIKSASIILKIHRFHRFSRNGLPVSCRTTFLE